MARRKRKKRSRSRSAASPERYPASVGEVASEHELEPAEARPAEARSARTRHLRCRVAAVGLLLGAGALAALWLLEARRAEPERGAEASRSEVEVVAAQPPGEVPTLETREGVDPLVLAAIDEAVAAVQQRREDGSRWGELGRLYQATEYHSLARRAYEEAARLSPATPSWAYYLGVDAARRGDAEAAVLHLQRAIELDPTYAPARLRLAEALLERGDLAAAEAAFGDYVTREPEQPWGHLGQGKAARRRGELEEAAGHLERALALRPGERQAAYLLAMTYRELGRASEAEGLLATLSSREEAPPDPLLAEVARRAPGLQILVRRANDLLGAGDLAAAEVLYRQVLEADPSHYTALVNLGNVYGRQLRSEEALALLRRAVEIDPDNPHARYGLALALLSLGRTGDARRELETVLDLDPAHPHAASLLARLQGSP